MQRALTGATSEGLALLLERRSREWRFLHGCALRSTGGVRCVLVRSAAPFDLQLQDVRPSVTFVVAVAGSHPAF